MGNYLPGDVIGLVAVKSCPVRDVCTSSQVNANIANNDLFREA